VAVELKLAAAQAARGDHAAFRSIVDNTKDGMFRLSCRMLGNVPDAEDALQDAYVKAYRALLDGKYTGEARVETWLYRIVTNSCLDALRRRRVRAVPVEEEVRAATPSPDAPLSPDAALALKELDEWLRDLPDDQRAVVVLRCVEGLTSAEAAVLLDCTEGAVEQRLVRARATLRKRRHDDA
jgi:RNA polymerase sigma-70 factor (ECF subfamily)